MEEPEENDIIDVEFIDITESVVPLDKKVFMQNYVLNRAMATSSDGGLSGEGAAKNALEAWNYIERSTREISYDR